MTAFLPLLAALVAYLVGSLSFAVIVSRAMGLSDPRTYGSGNPGATNVLRSGSKAAAILTLVLDALKGYLPVALVVRFGPVYGLGEGTVALVALAAFLGHLWPVFFRFKGGKGVATAAGAVLGIDPLLGAATLATWLIIAAFFRYSSLASIVAAVFAPFWHVLTDGPDAIALALLVIAGLLIWRHSANIKRLFAGTESRIGSKAAPPPAQPRRRADARLAADALVPARNRAHGRDNANRSLVGKPHRVAHLAHRLARDGACPLGADLDDPVHALRVREVLLGALAPRCLLANDRLDHRLLAVEAADRRAGAAGDDPGLGLLVRVHLVQLPHRALLGIARVGAPHARRVGLHVADLARDLGRLLAHRDRVAVALAHLRAVEADAASRSP